MNFIKRTGLIFFSCVLTAASYGKDTGKTLFIDRNAPDIYKCASSLTNEMEKRVSFMSAYAYAVGEENASGHMVVTAPTCGSSGVIPSVLYYLYHLRHYKYIPNYNLYYNYLKDI